MKPQNQIQSRTFTWVFVLLLIASGNLSAQNGNLTTIEFDGKTIQVFPTDHPQRLPWGPANNTSGANSTHDGRLNTQTIVDKYAGWNNGNYAARICAQLNAYGYDDWYLPSATEMAHIFGNRNKIQGLYQSSIYWTSTEEHWGADAAAIDLASGIILNRFKDESNRVRCVRGTHKLDEENNDRLDTHKNEPGVRGRVTGTEGMEGLRTHALVVVTNKEITKIYGESTIDAGKNYYIPNLPGGRTLYIHFLYSHKVWITEEIVISDWVDKNLYISLNTLSGGSIHDDLGKSKLGWIGVVGHYAEVYLHSIQGQNLQTEVALFQRIHYLRLLGHWKLHDRVADTSLGKLNLSGGGIITFNIDGTGTYPMGDIFYWKSQYKKTGIIRKLGIKTGSDYHLVITKSAYEDFYISGEIFATIYHDGDNYHMLWDESESFTKVNESGVKTLEKTTFNDPRDGQTYKWIRIGDQVWMAENLNYNAGSGSWCYNNETNNCNKYGRLYNWQTARNACPSGWHLPSDAEWTRLANFVGSSSGKKLKSSSGWNGPDDYGFSTLPGGYRNTDGTYHFLGNDGYWWSSTELSSTYAWLRFLDYDSGFVYRGHDDKDYGFSVRCVRDN